MFANLQKLFLLLLDKTVSLSFNKAEECEMRTTSHFNPLEGGLSQSRLWYRIHARYPPASVFWPVDNQLFAFHFCFSSITKSFPLYNTVCMIQKQLFLTTSISFIVLCICEKGSYISVYTSLKMEKNIVSYFTIFKTFIPRMPFVHR